MRDGADRSDVPYVWPQTLRLAVRPPKVVYLDLNHWVSLAKAWAGRDDGRQWAQSLAACLDAAQQGRAVFPLSDTIYHEVSKIRQHRQRRDLREVIESVSRYQVVTSRSVVSSHEIEALLDRLVGPNPHPISAMDYLDWGVARAFGMVGGFTVKSQGGEDVTAEVRSSYLEGPDAFDRFFAQAEWDLNRMVIEGPSAEDEPKLRELGWDPTRGFEIPQRRAAQEIDQVARFDNDPRWRRGRIRDVVAAREVAYEINEALFRGVSERGASLEDVFVQRDETRRAFDSMPSFDVAVSLKTEYHRDSTYRWTPNDIHDIDALGSTLPYCDIVVTDRSAAAHAQRAGLPERLSTLVLTRIVDLPEHL
jgi:hypothetical protein